MNEGYLGIFRKFFDHEFWGEKRKYSKAEAWIDLMQCARYSDKPETLLDKRGSYILDYGDVYISLRYLGERWQWSKNKVRHFLEYLEKRESITFKKRDSHRTIINITKLRVYTQWIKGERDSEGTVEGQSRDSEGTKKKKVKKEKNVKKDIYGVFKNVKLSTDECRKLVEKFGKVGTRERVEALSEGIESKGYKYSSHYATILTWERKDKKDNPELTSTSGGYDTTRRTL